ncbi:hypothetical protein UK23_04650 [Lentzea aerocolonigenes]|uniref:Uncharacterized protein n=1 Tax=Lentzea aerocolonigenes TaxID=68170 RepID=A0A0F0HCJ0_LENAE|nr:hypothetical protein [Lentzea aerocolonigenes]KJK52032.1 hypothetical protein UK23_04650 [Lentzea aerocolonigenes]
MRRRPLIVLGSAIVLTAAATFWYVSRPALDPAREQAITTYFEQNHWGGKTGWFCEGQVIEVDQGRDESEVGFLAMCQQYSVTNGELHIDAGDFGPRLATVTSPPRPVEVLRVDAPGDGSRYAPWIEDNFSWYGTKKLHRVERNAARTLDDATAAKARKAYGLPADAPVGR